MRNLVAVFKISLIINTCEHYRFRGMDRTHIPIANIAYSWCFLVDLCWAQPATYVSRAGFLLLVLIGEDNLAFQSFSGHFSHFTSDSFGLKATMYVIGEFLTKLFQELSASSLSIIERPVWIQ